MSLLIGINAVAQSVSTYAPKGKSVYIVSKDDYVQIETAKSLSGYWNVVDDSDKADVFVEFVTVRERTDRYEGYIKIFAPKTGKLLFKSEVLDSFGRWTYNAKKGIIKKMINKLIYD